MNTNIYISRKLEKIVHPSINVIQKNKLLNSINNWNANVFYVRHKKCLIITNSATKYSVLISKMTVSDFENLSSIFIKSFQKQLKADDIQIDLATIERIIGCVKVYSTNNDKSVIGIQNNILSYIDDWKYEFGNIDNWNFIEINCRINSIPYKQLDWHFPKERMKEMIKTCV